MPNPIVDSNFTSPYSSTVYEYTSYENIDRVGVTFYSSTLTPQSWEDNKSELVVEYLTKIDDNNYQIVDPANRSINNIVIISAEGDLLAVKFLSTPLNLGVVGTLNLVVNCYDQYIITIRLNFDININDHVDTAVSGDITDVHPGIFSDKIANKDYIGNKYDNFLLNNSTTLELVSEFDPDNPNVQVHTTLPTISCGKGRKYSYLLWYHLYPNIIYTYLHNIIPGYTMDKYYLGFNERFGSFLYHYNIRPDYIVVVIMGSTGYNFIDIVVCPNTAGIVDTSEYRLKMNLWYNNIYFVSNNTAYVIHMNKDPVIEPHTFTKGDSSITVSTRVYVPAKVWMDSFLTGELYMTEFSDIGDVLIRMNDDEPDFINIFNSSSSTNIKSLFNTYMIDNRPDKDLLSNMYRMTGYHLKYFKTNNYKPIYLGPSYSVGYNQFNDSYLILFKLNPDYERIRLQLDISTVVAFTDYGILFNDSTFLSFDSTVLDNYCNHRLDDDDPLITVDRGVIVCASMNGTDPIGAYRSIHKEI